MPCCGCGSIVDGKGQAENMSKIRGPTIEVEKETIIRLRDVGTDNIATDDFDDATDDDADESDVSESKYRDEGTDNIATDKNYMEKQNAGRSKIKTFIKYLTMSGAGGTSPPLTTHILDTSLGVPAANVPLILSVQNGPDAFTELEKGTTNNDGRAGFLNGSNWQPGVYKLRFDTGSYFRQNNVEGFYPYAEIVFNIKNTSQHYHVPLLLSPYSYSTYRGS